MGFPIMIPGESGFQQFARGRNDRISHATSKRAQRGEGLVSFLLAMAVLALILPVAINSMVKASSLSTVHAAAWHQQRMAEAATPYIKDNYATILANAASGTVTISTAMLRNAGYLSASVPDTNINKQTYQLLVNRVTVGGNQILQAVMPTFGGTAFTEDEVRQIAADNAKTGGGYISKLNPSLAQGYGGSYQLSLTPYGVSPGAGHLAMGLFFDSSGLIGDYLYRNVVPGHPELNRMNTAIDMNNNALNNASTVNTGDLQLRNVVSQGSACTQNGRVAQDGTGNPMACESGAWTYIASLSWVPGEGQRLRMMGANGQNMWLENNNGRLRLINSGWTAELASIDQGGNLTAQGSISAAGNISANGQITSNGRLTTNEYLQLNGGASEGSPCPSNGLVAQNGGGLILSCQSGVWRASASRLQRMTWMVTENEGPIIDAYGDICQAQLDSMGLSGVGWVATGSDACTEDGRDCTGDGIRCFAVNLSH